MKKLIIFGRSPFVNKVDVSKIDYDKYDVCCINQIVPGTKPKYVVSADRHVFLNVPKTACWVSTHTGWNLDKCKEIITEDGHLTWRYYSSSVAVNLAALQRYKTLYLAGINLVKTTEPMVNFDGSVCPKGSEIFTYEAERQFIKELGELYGMEIYTLDKDVDWLEYKDIGIVRKDKK